MAAQRSTSTRHLPPARVIQRRASDEIVAARVHCDGMHLAHSPSAVASLRAPTQRAPWRVLASGCLTGQPVGVDGTHMGLAEAWPRWLAPPLVEVVAFCPEAHRLGAPRTTPDLHGGDGFDVLDGRATVRDEHGVDLTEQVVAGAAAMRDLALARRVDFAVLTDRSGTCGSQVVSTGCRFDEPVQFRLGVGVATAALLRAGVPVVSQRDFRTLELLRARVDPAHRPAPDARDHHEHPWVIEHLGTTPSDDRPHS